MEIENLSKHIFVQLNQNVTTDCHVTNTHFYLRLLEKQFVVQNC
jgi:hypothetical protein